MKKLHWFIFSLLLFATLFSPLTSFAAPLQQDQSKTTKEIHEKIELPKLDKQKAAILEERYTKEKQHLKPVQQLNVKASKQLKKSQNKHDSTSSQGKFIKSKNSPIPKTSATVISDSVKATTTDNRVKITDTTVNPYNAMAQIDFRDAQGNWYICSGTFLDKTTVLTAAHCVYDNYNHEFFTYWNVYPGENGTNLPYGSASSTNVYAPTGWVNSNAPGDGLVTLNDVQYDYAVIKVNSNHTPNLQVSTASNIGDAITTHGYPGDKGIGGYYYLYKSTGAINNVIDNAIVHSTTVTGGMSGGPILKSGSIISVNSTSSWGAKLGATHLGLINAWKAQPY